LDEIYLLQLEVRIDDWLLVDGWSSDGSSDQCSGD
jgi:hypothetical protein